MINSTTRQDAFIEYERNTKPHRDPTPEHAFVFGVLWMVINNHFMPCEIQDGMIVTISDRVVEINEPN